MQKAEFWVTDASQCDLMEPFSMMVSSSAVKTGCCKSRDTRKLYERCMVGGCLALDGMSLPFQSPLPPRGKYGNNQGVA